MKKIVPKVNHEWSILSSSSIVDTTTNNLSLINVIEQVTFNAELKEGQSFDNLGEVIPLSMVITTRLRKFGDIDSTAKGNLKIKLTDPKGKNMGSFQKDFEMGPGINNIRMRSGIEGLKVTSSGQYRFEILLKEETQKNHKNAYSLPLELFLKIS